MIARLRGEVAAVEPEWAVLDVGGIGYQVFAHPRMLAWLEAAAGPVTVHVHTAVREDAISLFGFASAEELAVFRLLIGVERVGPRAALAILGRAEWPTLVRTIAADDPQLLASVPGIGAKTAARLILELRGKLDGLAGAALQGERPAAPPGPLTTAAVEAVVGLGYPAPTARRAVRQAVEAAGGAASLDQVVTDALRRLDPGAGERSSR
ncbi:MAG TPA: Holliday junction branch migration protein RuvA [Candidatus Micrarchaeia archaeon]|nr:Holliday junction branch migration protein RuvA [Candidatus Micrarchaeia archaeon]